MVLSSYGGSTLRASIWCLHTVVILLAVGVLGADDVGHSFPTLHSGIDSLCLRLSFTVQSAHCFLVSIRGRLSHREQRHSLLPIMDLVRGTTKRLNAARNLMMPLFA